MSKILACFDLASKVRVDVWDFETHSSVECNCLIVVSAYVKRKGVLRISVKQVGYQLSANSLSLAVNSDANSEKIDTWDSILSKSKILKVTNGENSVTNNCLCVFLSGNEYFVVLRAPEFFHNKSCIRLATAFKSLFVNEHE